jgi:methylglutamate dehydrogenase subunit C
VSDSRQRSPSTAYSDSATAYRLSTLGLIDRSQPLHFTFDGRDYTGFQGDTLSAALLASGLRVVGRSFKYHRPRGVLTAGSEEPNALVELRCGARREPNTRATVTELYEGLEARSQNRWPSLRFDVGAINSLLSAIFVAGFYYKTFMWPSAWWEKLYEPLIRRAAGLGRASSQADPDGYEKAHAFCDVLVIGAGPAGLAAALVAGRSGARVILCDEDFILGGRLNHDRHEIDGTSGSHWARRTEAELASMSAVRLMRRTTVFGAYDGGLSGAQTFGALERVADHLPVPPQHQPRQRLWRIVARRAILACGAIERPIVFGGNDRPGVMMASAVRAYLNRFAVAAGRRIALFTASDDGWKTAADLAAVGVELEAIVDARSEVAPRLLEQAQRWKTRVLAGARVIEARGGQSLRRVVVRDNAGRHLGLAVDTLAMSGGWNPSLALSTHLGGRPRWSPTISAFVPGDLPRGMSVAGAVRGTFALADVLREGALSGAEAATSSGFSAKIAHVWRTEDEPAHVGPLWQAGESTSKAFVDMQNDVTAEDVALATREGYGSVELLKRYTTLGMGTDQGKTSNLNGHAIVAALTHRALPEVGTTTFRPPFSPIAIGALANQHRGGHFRPTRLPASHRWAEEYGARFVEAGLWLRAQWYARPHEHDWRTTVSREVRAVRRAVGVCDVSTLGKIDVQGADAGAFLDRVYCNTFSTLPVARVRYGLMLREDGLVLDDGTIARLGSEHYLLSTTTANAAKVMQHLEHARQVLWPELDLQMVSVTEQWAQYSIAGPSSRRLLECLLEGALDVSKDSFPYLTCAEFSWRGIVARLFRVSFSGELAYELAVPARYGDSVIRAIIEAGMNFGVTPYGTEALGVMRIEKGHVAGNELNGTTTAGDLGLGRMMSNKKDYIGRILAARAALSDPDRPTLVGVRPLNPAVPIYAGAHLVGLQAQAKLEESEGYLTSVAYSPTLNSWIGLGLLTRGTERHGQRLRAHSPLTRSDVPIEVVSPHFYDPTGARLHG